MFARLLQRFRDMKTIGQLISGADKQANQLGEEKPGAEHFVLSALNLNDGSAKRVFAKLGIDGKQFQEAVQSQYKEALQNVGIDQDALNIEPEAVAAQQGVQRSQPSGQALMKALYALKQKDKTRPLLGAHVISVAAAIEYGVVPRAFNILGIERDKLGQIAKEEWESFKA